MRIHEMVSRNSYPNASQMAREMEVNRKTIQRDINRTFPAHDYFRESGGVGQDAPPVGT